MSKFDLAREIDITNARYLRNKNAIQTKVNWDELQMMPHHFLIFHYIYFNIWCTQATDSRPLCLVFHFCHQNQTERHMGKHTEPSNFSLPTPNPTPGRHFISFGLDGKTAKMTKGNTHTHIFVLLHSVSPFLAPKQQGNRDNQVEL